MKPSNGVWGAALSTVRILLPRGRGEASGEVFFSPAPQAAHVKWQRLTWDCLKACWQPPPPDSACPNPDQWETIPAATSLSCAPFMQFPIEVIFLLESLLVSFPNENPHCSHADPQWGPCDLASSHISSCITALRPRLSQHTHTHTHYSCGSPDPFTHSLLPKTSSSL